MSIYVIIPARYGSVRFPGKPLALINGRPMISHVVERALKVLGPSQVVLATDDERIAQAVAGFSVQVVFTDSTLPSGSDRVAQAAQKLGLTDDDIVINVQGDQPCIVPELILQCAQLLLDNPDINLATPVVQEEQDLLEEPNWVKVVMDNRNRALYFSRAPIPFNMKNQPIHLYRHIGLYAFRNWLLQEFISFPPGRLEQIEMLEQLRILEAGYAIHCVITDYDSPEVNVPQDVLLAEAWLKGEALYE